MLPQIQYKLAWHIGGSTEGIHLSSDTWNGANHAPGSTLHADFFDAWDPTAMDKVVEKIRTEQDCGTNQLGDGYYLRPLEQWAIDAYGVDP